MKTASKLSDLIAFLEAHGPATYHRAYLKGCDGGIFRIRATWLSRYANEKAISLGYTRSPKYGVPTPTYDVKACPKCGRPNPSGQCPDMGCSACCTNGRCDSCREAEG